MAKARYNRNLKEKATYLRNNMTYAERKIWFEFLRKLNIPINRQKIIDNYIVDFFCSKASLIVEIDGDTHFSDEDIEYDKSRSSILESMGFQVIRYRNDEIITNFDNCTNEILLILEKKLNLGRHDLLKKNF